MGSVIGSLASTAGSLFAIGQNKNPTDGERDTHEVTQRNLGLQSDLNNEYTALAPQRTQFGSTLAAGALGQGPSIAETMLKANNERTLAQQLSAARANRAVNPALAARQLSNAATQQNMQTAQQASIARLQEQRQQQDAFANYLNNNLQNQRGFLSGGETSAAANAAQETGRRNATTTAAVAGIKGVGDTLGAGAGAFGGGGGAAADPLAGMSVESQPSYNPSYVDTSMPAQTNAERMTGFSRGGAVPGLPQVQGDSPINDTVNAKLSPGEVVLPRSVVQRGPDSAAKFMAAVQGKQAPSQSKATFGDVIAAKKQLEAHLAHIDGLLSRKKA